jgi:DNA-binding transcriptional LysR family regulator
LAFNLQGGQQRGWNFIRDGKLVSIRVEGDLACNDGELLFSWVKQGIGIGWRSTWEIQAELKKGTLVTVLDEFAALSYPIQAVYPQQRFLPAKVRHFIDYLKELYNQPGYWEG